jgi:AAA15 family ATPase/GTPase
MRSAFESDNLIKDIKIELRGNEVQPFSCILQNDNSPYSQWVRKNFSGDGETFLKTAFNSVIDKYGGEEKLHSILFGSILLGEKRNFSAQEKSKFAKLLQSFSMIFSLHTFIIYSPENLALRTFEKEGQIQPLGINGEGLFKLLKVLNSDNQEQLNEIKKKLQLIDWFQDFEAPPNLSSIQNSLQIKDRYLDPDLAYFDQRSSNEGFLFLLFYFALFISDITPKFFAIDNIDASLNPRLCRRLMQELVELAKKYDKQVIFTTHNPAVLDGLDLHDDEQRLFVIYRNQLGHTKARRILKPEPLEGQEPVKLSEAFLRGYIGGLPKNF